MNIKNYLHKITQTVPLETQVRNSVIQVVGEVLGVALERQKITVSRDVITVHVSSVIKNEIALKQAKILARMYEINPDLKIKKIQ